MNHIKIITIQLPKSSKFLVLLLLITFFSTALNAQIFKGEIIGGFNLSQVDGDETFGYKKIGLNGGFGVVAQLNKNFALSLETLYSQKGSRLGKQRHDTVNGVFVDGSYKLKLNYFEIPLIFYYTDNIVYGGVGMSYNRLVEVGEWRNNIPIDTVNMKSGVFKPDDWVFLVDLRVRVYKNFIANVRYNYSIREIANRYIRDSETGNMNWRSSYNNLWSFRLIYMINEQPPERKAPKNFKENL